MIDELTNGWYRDWMNNRMHIWEYPLLPFYVIILILVAILLCMYMFALEMFPRWEKS